MSGNANEPAAAAGDRDSPRAADGLEDIVEEEVPGVRPSYGLAPEPRIDRTRRRIAYALIGILAWLVVVGTVGWLIGWFVDAPSEEADVASTRSQLQSYGALFAPVVTLVGTILGFYFSSNEPNR